MTKITLYGIRDNTEDCPLMLHTLRPFEAMCKHHFVSQQQTGYDINIEFRDLEQLGYRCVPVVVTIEHPVMQEGKEENHRLPVDDEQPEVVRPKVGDVVRVLVDKAWHMIKGDLVKCMEIDNDGIWFEGSRASIQTKLQPEDYEQPVKQCPVCGGLPSVCDNTCSFCTHRSNPSQDLDTHSSNLL